MKCPKCGSSNRILIIERIHHWRELYETDGEVHLRKEGTRNVYIIEIQCCECDHIVMGDGKGKAEKAFGLPLSKEGGKQCQVSKQ